MRGLGKSLLMLALVVAVGVGLVVWLGPALSGDPFSSGAGDGPAAGDETSGGDAPAGIPAGAATMTVTYVHDGDTLYLDPGAGGEELKVRLIGIDTPEIGEHAECFGDVARDRLRAVLPEGAEVAVIAEDSPLDQYGRSLLHVFLPDGTHVNRLLIDEGLARAMFFDPNRDVEGEFRDAERAARSAGVGMWGGC